MERKSAWDKIQDKKIVFRFCDDYIKYLNHSKTERVCVSYTRRLAEAAGFKELDTIDRLKPGMKVYKINRGKNIVLAAIGKDDIDSGFNLVAAHIDSPRIDVKQIPLYEDSNLALFKTHYYGGIKKYQWTAIPLSLIGVVVLEDGTVIDVNIGESENDPVFTITDLLPHLASEQMAKKMSEGIGGEDLNIIIGSLPSDCEKDKYKQTVIDLLQEKYQVQEEDFISAELELVPNFNARSLGLDSSMIAAYGQDDRVCAYTAYKAIAELDVPQRTAICFLADKEEIGSMGNTGMQSRFFENFVAKLIAKQKDGYCELMLKDAFSNAMCLSSDVTCAMDPTFKSVSEPLNSAYLGEGVAFSKFTGARGKSSTSDASAEFVAKIRKILNDADVAWQMTELGKVDQGGGGTVAQYIANLDVDTIDCGVPLLSMHAPYEVSSKVDVYMAYKAYKAFYVAE
ncbi:MAG: aminopeptidase [Ruminococcaceae bacterium]|nr:aminopeptidase [Oscillospiraceae bacterium]